MEISFDNHCAICKVNEATQFCDYVIRYDKNPIFFRDYKMFKDSIENGNDETCDLPLCDKCRHLIGGADLCPHHYKLQLQAELPEHLKKAQTRSKSRIYSIK